MFMSWTNQGTSIRMDVMCLAFALALHAPLMFMKFETKKKAVDRRLERLVSVDVLDQIPEKKVAPPPVKVKKKSGGLMAKLKALMKTKPPPPPPKPKVVQQPKKLDLGPKEIKLQPKLKTPEKLQAKLKTKSGFKTAADPKLVKQKQISLKSLGAGVAPLTAKKLGTLENRKQVKKNKGNFKVARGESLSSIGGSGPGLADPSAPTIAIKTGRRGSTEKFSQAAPQRANKGKFSGGAAGSLGAGANLSLRDAVIARSAAPTQIGSTSKAGVPGGVPGGRLEPVKKDAGRFQGSSSGSLLGTRVLPSVLLL